MAEKIKIMSRQVFIVGAGLKHLAVLALKARGYACFCTRRGSVYIIEAFKG